jgi:hypothetical protein
MAHMGRRYGDPYSAVAGRGRMSEVAERDQLRIRHIEQGDASSFWESLHEGGDDLKWCGSSCFYTFLKAVPAARGRKLGYEQWNIDDSSIVSFGALAFQA